jgi:hypothetical protein
MEELYKGYKIRIEQDNDPQNPREDGGMGIMICFHSRYTLGDNHSYTAGEDFILTLAEEVGISAKKRENLSVRELVEEISKKLVILPLYLYDHSGISMKCYRFGQHKDWDCGQVGFIYTTAKRVKELCGKRKSHKYIEDQLIQEVETYSQYISGDVVGFIAEDQTGEQIDSCWGFYSTEEAIQEAKNEIDYHIREQEAEKARNLKEEFNNLEDRLHIGV